jgi:hypothetical protein
MISLSMAGRCVVEGQTVDGVNSGINRMAKLMRTFTTQMEALQRYRGKGQQTIQVQHVQVNEGGQAVVGNVQGAVSKWRGPPPMQISVGVALRPVLGILVDAILWPMPFTWWQIDRC